MSYYISCIFRKVFTLFNLVSSSSPPYLCFILCLTFITPIFTLAEEHIESRIHHIVQKYHKQHFFHGNIIIKKTDEVVYQNSFGLAHDAFDVPHTIKSRFMIASVSKSFTAALILILAQEGLVDIDLPYSYYIPIKRAHPETRKHWDTFTVRDLLTHSAGIYDHVRPTEFYQTGSYEPFLSSIVEEQITNYNIFIHPKGLSYYSNFGYMLLAHLAEQVTGHNYEGLLKVKIFIPLGMNSSGEYHRMKNIKFMAEGYLYPDGSDKLRKRCCHDTTSYRGSHSLYSSAEDLMLWLDNFCSQNPKVLSKESIEAITKGHVKVHNKPIYYGFGFFVDEFHNQQRYWHSGFEYGYLSLVSILPEINLKIVILSNRHIATDGNFIHKMNDEISQLFIPF